MAKLYKAVDKTDTAAGNKCWLVNVNGVAISTYQRGDAGESDINKKAESFFSYEHISRFGDAINPVLIAEW